MSFPVEAVLSQNRTGAATDNLKKQWAALIRYVPELESCAQGTINVVRRRCVVNRCKRGDLFFDEGSQAAHSRCPVTLR